MIRKKLTITLQDDTIIKLLEELNIKTYEFDFNRFFKDEILPIIKNEKFDIFDKKQLSEESKILYKSIKITNKLYMIDIIDKIESSSTTRQLDKIKLSISLCNVKKYRDYLFKYVEIRKYNIKNNIND